MKKLGFLFALSAIFVSSCKKDYTCTCTDTTGGNSTAFIIPSATKQEAATICLSNEVYAQGGTQTTTCTFK